MLLQLVLLIEGKNILLTLARACAAKGYCSRSGRSVGPSVPRLVNLLVCDFVSPHVFSLTVAAVDAKRGYVGMCNGSSAQQESGAALSKNSMFTAGAKNYIQLLY